jgi:murein L,D-transpeptidase YafK
MVIRLKPQARSKDGADKGGTVRPKFRFGSLLAAAALMLAGCGSAPELLPAEQPLPKETLDLIGKKGMQPGMPIFVRIFKEESELEVWKAREDGRFYHFKTYPICNWSGELGPKVKMGDKQAPEGFYAVGPKQMKPDSKYHVAFNLGFPNAYDRANDRTGEYLMIHGKCKSAGCYAMTDALAEEIYALARDAFRNGQTAFEVHAFPFRMTDEKLARFKGQKNYAFWAMIKPGYDFFEAYRVPPTIAVCERKYVVGVTLPATGRVDPDGACPRFQKQELTPFVPNQLDQQIANQKGSIVPGAKARESTALAWSDGEAPATKPATAAPAAATGSISEPPPAQLPAAAHLVAEPVPVTRKTPAKKPVEVPTSLGLNAP